MVFPGGGGRCPLFFSLAFPFFSLLGSRAGCPFGFLSPPKRTLFCGGAPWSNLRFPLSRAGSEFFFFFLLFLSYKRTPAFFPRQPGNESTSYLFPFPFSRVFPPPPPPRFRRYTGFSPEQDRRERVFSSLFRHKPNFVKQVLSPPFLFLAYE